jgi:heme exporter protein B
MSAAFALLRRDLLLGWRRRGDMVTVVVFFLLTVALFPLGLGPRLDMLAGAAPGIIWVTALLAATLSLERIFLADYEDGALEVLALSPVPLELAVLAKCAAHWLTTGLPLTLAAPLLGLMLNLPDSAYPPLVLAMLLGTPALSLVGGIGAALTLGARRGGVLLPLLVLPLFIPVLVFGVSAIDATLAGLSPRPHLLILGALLLGAAALAPLAAAAALRQALE